MRALINPYPDSRSYTPSLPDLRFALLRNTPVEHEGFTLALFSQSSTSSSEATSASATSTPAAAEGESEAGLAVNAMGQVLIMSREDWAKLMRLVKQFAANKLPETGYRNTWIVEHETTCQPIDRLLVPSAEGQLEETGVSGFSYTERRLNQPVEGITELPEVLFHLVLLGLEGRDGYVKGEEDPVMIDKIKNLLKAYF